MAKEPSLFYYLPIVKRQIYTFPKKISAEGNNLV